MIPGKRVGLRRGGIGAVFLLIAAVSSIAGEYKVHLLSPWLQDPARKDMIPHITSNDLGPAYPGAPMKATGGGWYEYSWNLTTPPATYAAFYFTSYIPNADNPYAQGEQYLNNALPFRFGDSFPALGVNEIWIVPQGPGKPPLITDTPQVKKVAYLFNPWPISAPMARTTAAGPWTLMRASSDPARCGWYLHYFTGPEPTLSFKSLIGNQIYGSTGLGGAQALDLAAAFANADTLYLVPDPAPGGPPRILSRFPDGMSGTCGFPLAVTVRDFSKLHPDFEKGQAMGDAVVKGMVMPTLGPDKKPVKGSNPHPFQSRFQDWFRAQSGQNNPDWNNYETCKDLPLSKNDQGYWAYDSYLAPDHGYFPIDDFNKFNQTSPTQYIVRGTEQVKDGAASHNFHFCMELHAQFEYRLGQVFKFSGDDDVWVYINNKLAIDLGGTHRAATDSVNLDKLSLTEGSKYDFDMFYCERQTTGSNLLLQTSIYFEQEQSVFAKKTPLPGDKSQYDIYEILSGDKSCGAAQGGDTVIANSVFRLSGPSVNPAEVLATGVSHGGITLNPAKTQVTVDTARITGLRPGVYTVSFTSERSGKGGFIQFTVNGSFAADFIDKRENAPAYTGEVSAVSIQTVWNGKPDPRADTVVLKPQAGLIVYADSAKTQVIAPPNTPWALPANGNKRVYVSADATGTYSLELFGGKGQPVSMDRETFTFEKPLVPPAVIRTARYLDVDGDGRIETVVIKLSQTLPAAPAKLSFTIQDAKGANETRTAAASEITQSGDITTVRLANPFSYGITSMTNGGTSGTWFEQAGLQVRPGPFAIDDSVAPVILEAETREPDSANPYKRVLFEVSEAVVLPLSSPTALVFKRRTSELTTGLRLRPTLKTGERTFAVVVDTTSDVFPIAGDSLALTDGGEVEDTLGNAPRRKLFVRIGGQPPKAKPMELYVTFPNGSREEAKAGTLPNSLARFIPVDSRGAPLPGNPGDGRCAGCPAMEGNTFAGPVFHIVTAGPMEYTFRIFTNTGEFVATGQGRIGEADLPLLQKRNDASGVRYIARVVWTGQTEKGGRAGTGAYVLVATLQSPKDLKTGAGPRSQNRKIRFGMLRGF
jgi:fibro-slime domain-containing protein